MKMKTASIRRLNSDGRWFRYCWQLNDWLRVCSVHEYDIRLNAFRINRNTHTLHARNPSGEMGMERSKSVSAHMDLIPVTFVNRSAITTTWHHSLVRIFDSDFGPPTYSYVDLLNVELFVPFAFVWLQCINNICAHFAFESKQKRSTFNMRKYILIEQLNACHLLTRFLLLQWHVLFSGIQYTRFRVQISFLRVHHCSLWSSCRVYRSRWYCLFSFRSSMPRASTKYLYIGIFKQ